MSTDEVDLDQRDPTFIRNLMWSTQLLVSRYFRAEVLGLQRIPTDEPVLLVGNHSGGFIPSDTIVFIFAFCSHFGVERPFYQLVHELGSLPGLGWLHKVGTIPADPANAKRVLEAGNAGALLVYPGGDYEGTRPSWERHVVDFGGRQGFVRLARDSAVRIVPVASVGGQETALFLDRGQWLAKLLRIDKLLRLKSLPISIGLPWGLNISAVNFPLPAKITIEVQEPIDLDGSDQAVYDAVVGSLQAGVDRLAAERQFPVVG